MTGGQPPPHQAYAPAASTPRTPGLGSYSRALEFTSMVLTPSNNKGGGGGGDNVPLAPRVPDLDEDGKIPSYSCWYRRPSSQRVQDASGGGAAPQAHREEASVVIGTGRGGIVVALMRPERRAGPGP